MFDAIVKIFTKVRTALTNPLRTKVAKIQKLFNVNVIVAKLVTPITKKIKEILVLKPSNKNDYYTIAGFLVFKKLGIAVVLVACAGVFLYFSLYADPISSEEVVEAAVETTITYAYNDMDLCEFEGVANITADGGQIVYIGNIVKGVCEGQGKLYDLEGHLIYEGEFSNNQYNGAGIAYYTNGEIAYQGAFVNNAYEGEGMAYSNDGAIVYAGSFQGGVYEGQGTSYTADGLMYYQGAFSGGQFHGYGVQYAESGLVQYEGDFFGGVAQGSGMLYDTSGKLIYTGSMKDGHINYEALVGSSLLQLEEAFAESPVIFYSSNEAVFVFANAGIIINTSCRVMIDVTEYETESTTDSSLYYYMPTSTTQTLGESVANVLGVTTTNMATGSSLLFTTADQTERESYTLIDWYSADDVMDSDTGTTTDTSTSTDTTTTTSDATSDTTTSDTTSDTTTSDTTTSTTNTYTASTETSTETSDDTTDTTSDATTATVTTPTDDTSAESDTSDTPSFITRDVVIYYEIDTGVWRSENDASWAEDKALVTVQSVTIFGQTFPDVPEGTTSYDDNSAPQIEECVAIDYLRLDQPTLMSEIYYEFDKSNSLFVWVMNVDYSTKIDRKSYASGDLVYRFGYTDSTYETIAYCTVEKAG